MRKENVFSTRGSPNQKTLDHTRVDSSDARDSSDFDFDAVLP
jgi:hypothetical protein